MEGRDKRERVTWRLDPSNYDFVDRERERLGLYSMSAALNVILAEHRQKCLQIEAVENIRVTADHLQKHTEP